MGKTEGKKLLGEFTGHAKETAKKVTKNIIQRIDQNDDGKFDMSDVAKINLFLKLSDQFLRLAYHFSF